MFQRTIRSQRASVLRLSPRKRSRREKTRRREKREMNGRRRPHRDVQESEIWPIRGTCGVQRFPHLLVWKLITVKSARKGATPRMIDMFVSVKPAWKIKFQKMQYVIYKNQKLTFRRSGGMKVKATQAAISSPATTALIANSRGTVRTRKGCIFISLFLSLGFWFRCFGLLALI